MCRLPLCQKAYLGDTHVNRGTMAENWAMPIRIKYLSVSDDWCHWGDQGQRLQEVTSCWHANKLPCKTHQRLHQVAFFESYYPAWVTLSIALTGQKGYHHNTKINKIYKINQGYFIKEGKLINNNASSDYDLSDKNINPLVDFVHLVTWPMTVMLKDCIIGTKKQVLTCKSSLLQTKWWVLEKMTSRLLIPPPNLTFTASRLWRTRKHSWDHSRRTELQRKRGPSVRTDCTTGGISIKWFSSAEKNVKKNVVSPINFCYWSAKHFQDNILISTKKISYKTLENKVTNINLNNSNLKRNT